MHHPNNSHLTDTQLQLHLEGQTLTTNQQTHLANCPLCVQQLQLYQQMYVGFNQLIMAIGIAAYLGLFKSIIPLLTNNTWAVAQLLTAVLATVLLFQWIEYRFWNSKMA